MLTISLEQLHFHTGVGLYPEEKILGNDLLIDIHIRVPEEHKSIDSLCQTVDYAKVYELVKEEVEQEHTLLETVAEHCIGKIKKAWPQVKEVEIVIKKLHPPLPGEVGCSKITLSKKL